MKPYYEHAGITRLADIPPFMPGIPWREWQAEQDRLARRAQGRTSAEQAEWERKHPIIDKPGGYGSYGWRDMPRTMRPKPKQREAS